MTMTLREQIDQVVKSNLSDRDKVDELFRIDCKMYTNLGSDSTKTEIEKTKKDSRIIYRAVQEIDFWLGSACLRTQDDKKKAQ
jgi:hypothetical protein